VGVRNHENTWPVARSPTEQDIAVTIAPPDPLDREAEGADARRNEVHHAIDRCGIIGRAFDTNPIEELGQKRISGEIESMDHAALPAWLALAVIRHSLPHEFSASNARASLGRSMPEFAWPRQDRLRASL